MRCVNSCFLVADFAQNLAAQSKSAGNTPTLLAPPDWSQQSGAAVHSLQPLRFANAGVANFWASFPHRVALVATRRTNTT